jgi:WD40 repeat protein
MIESWRAAVAAGDPDLQHAARANLSAWLPYYPRLKAIFSHARPVEGAAFSADGKLVVTGGDDGTARVWDTATGQPTGLVLEHPREVNSVAFSPEGRTILTGSSDGIARLWDASTGRLAGPPLRHEVRNEGRDFVTVLFSPDGESFVTGCLGTLQRWQTASCRPIGPALRGRGTPWAFTPDGKAIVSSGSPCLWDTITSQPVGPNFDYPSWARSMALSRDGNSLLIGGNDGSVRLFDTATGKLLLPPIRGHGDWVRGAAISPDGELLLTGSNDKRARLWDAYSGQPVGPPIQHEGPVVAVAFSPDGKSFLTASSDFTVRLWEIEVHQPIRRVLNSGACGAAAFSPDGKIILTGNHAGTAQFWDTADGQRLGAPLRHSAGINDHCVAFSPDGRLALTGSGDRTARLWAVPSGRPVGPPLEHRGRVWAVAFHPDGKTILTGGSDLMVRFWDVATCTLIGAPLPQPDTVNAVAISRDGKTFVAGYGNGAAQLWDMATRRPLGKPFPHPGSIESLAFSPDGRAVLTGGEDRMARLWSVASGELLLSPLATGHWIWSVAFSSDGKVLAAGDSDSVRLWDAATGLPIGPILHYQAEVGSVAFSPDDRTLLTGWNVGGARLFSLAAEVPDELDRVANWVELLTGMELKTSRGSIYLLDNAAWLASRKRVEKGAGPPIRDESPPGPSQGRAPGLAGTLALARSQHAREQNNLAWGLATRPDAKSRDPARAVELARNAVRLAPKSGSIWNTLGVARYRAGDWPGAIEALAKSEELAPGTHVGFNAFFLAMAYWKLGHKDESRQWYGWAVQWTEKHLPKDEELRRFRAEAAGLLGLEPGTDREEEHPLENGATYADRFLHVEPSPARARGERSVGQSADAAMPNGPGAFARP